MAAVAVPNAAHAFVYNGTEYFDVFFGIDPAWWGFLIFCIIYCGAVLKNAVEKYNLPRTGNADLLKPAKTGKFRTADPHPISAHWNCTPLVSGDCKSPIADADRITCRGCASVQVSFDGIRPTLRHRITALSLSDAAHC